MADTIISNLIGIIPTSLHARCRELFSMEIFALMATESFKSLSLDEAASPREGSTGLGRSRGFVQKGFPIGFAMRKPLSIGNSESIHITLRRD
jgi:hypothetical protein